MHEIAKRVAVALLPIVGVSTTVAAEPERAIAFEGARLLPVTVGNLGEVGRCLDFFMGKNTQERRSFIVDNLATGVV